MSATNNLGEFEITVMAALLHLGDEAYGARIRQEIEQRTERKATVGAIYTTLSRLEHKGLVRSKLGDSSANRGGRAKRYFRVTALGNRRLQSSVTSLANILDGLPIWTGSAS